MPTRKKGQFLKKVPVSTKEHRGKRTLKREITIGQFTMLTHNNTSLIKNTHRLPNIHQS